jgi:hypothetical protein
MTLLELMRQLDNLDEEDSLLAAAS